VVNLPLRGFFQTKEEEALKRVKIELFFFKTNNNKKQISQHKQFRIAKVS